MAQGRVLAVDVASTRQIPPADNSAMDGFAVACRDVEGASPERPKQLPVAFEVAAGGMLSEPLVRGTAARIFTGAPVPLGADAVVRQEDTTHESGGVAIRVQPELGENIRCAGEDLRPGDPVLTAGTRVGSAEVGILAALGRSFVSVIRRPRVAILSGGDELVEPDGDISGGKIVSSNSYSIAALCRELGAEPVYLGIAKDTPEELAQHFRAGLASDVLVSSAGVSVGDRDYVRPVLESLGCALVFWGVKMKPGYPLVFGDFPERGPLVFGLPGNPVSAMMTFEQFVRPALLRMMGHNALHRPQREVVLGETLHKKAGRLHFVRVRLDVEAGELIARTTGNQSSGVLRSMVDADGILIFPAAASELRAGSRATVQVLNPDVLAPASPGFE